MNFTVGSDDYLYLDGKRVAVTAQPATHHYGDGVNTIKYIIEHYTASTTMQSAINNYLDPKVQLSWHLTIDRDGTVVQLLDFKKIAWHAGQSSWKDSTGKEINGLNPCSIGFEHVNAGPLTKEPDGTFKTWSGQHIDISDVFMDTNGNPWQKFTDVQLQVSKAVSLAIAHHYKCEDILSHHDIAPFRKQDTGPAYQETLDEMRNEYKSVIDAILHRSF